MLNPKAILFAVRCGKSECACCPLLWLQQKLILVMASPGNSRKAQSDTVYPIEATLAKWKTIPLAVCLQWGPLPKQKAILADMYNYRSQVEYVCSPLRLTSLKLQVLLLQPIGRIWAEVPLDLLFVSCCCNSGKTQRESILFAAQVMKLGQTQKDIFCSNSQLWDQFLFLCMPS